MAVLGSAMRGRGDGPNCTCLTGGSAKLCLCPCQCYVNPPDMMAVCMNNAGSGNSGKEVAGAWMLMVEVSVQDPAAPSWEFLQVRSCTVSRLYAITVSWPYSY